MGCSCVRYEEDGGVNLYIDEGLFEEDVVFQDDDYGGVDECCAEA